MGEAKDNEVYEEDLVDYEEEAGAGADLPFGRGRAAARAPRRPEQPPRAEHTPPCDRTTSNAAWRRRAAPWPGKGEQRSSMASADGSAAAGRGPASSEPTLSSSSEGSSSLTFTGPDCLESVEDPDLVALPAIRVPKSKIPPLDGQLEKGVNDIHHLVKDVLDKRMSSWEKYCLRHCFTVPEGFMAPEDDNSSAKESHKDGTCDSDLDAKLDSLRRKLENANKESEELQREISSLERQTTYKRNLNSSIAEVLKLFEDKSVQDNIQDLVNAIPKWHQKMKGMKRKTAEIENMAGQSVWSSNGLRNKKRLALGFTASTEDIQEVVNGLRKE